MRRLFQIVISHDSYAILSQLQHFNFPKIQIKWLKKWTYDSFIYPTDISMILPFRYKRWVYHTRGSLRWLKKSSKEVLSREDIWRPNTLRWLKIRSNQYLELSFCANFELSQSFRSEKVSHLGVLTRDQDFEPVWSWAISKSRVYAFTWQHLLRWLFEPSPAYEITWNE